MKITHVAVNGVRGLSALGIRLFQSSAFFSLTLKKCRFLKIRLIFLFSVTTLTASNKSSRHFFKEF